MSRFTPGRNGCVNVFIKLTSASALMNKAALQKALSNHVEKSAYGKGSITNLNLAQSVVSFTVNGQCDFYLSDLENIVISLGGLVELSDGTLHTKP